MRNVTVAEAIRDALNEPLHQIGFELTRCEQLDWGAVVEWCRGPIAFSANAEWRESDVWFAVCHKEAANWGAQGLLYLADRLGVEVSPEHRRVLKQRKAEYNHEAIHQVCINASDAIVAVLVEVAEVSTQQLAEAPKADTVAQWRDRVNLILWSLLIFFVVSVPALLYKLLHR